MFTDEDLDPVGFPSSWKKERSLTETGVQTRELEVEDQSCQAKKTRDAEIMTDETIEEDINLFEDDSRELSHFLKHHVPDMIHEIKRNLRSHAFDDYELLGNSSQENVEQIHTLQNPEMVNRQLHITGLSWNSTGSVIAASYGRLDHEDWCTHTSSLCTWNLSRRGLDENKPDFTIDLSCCLSCIAFHPTKPGWIAGGTFNGEIIVWDTSREDDPVIASSGMNDDAHREPVTRVDWVPDPSSKGKKYHVVSTGNDGKILVWRLSSKQRLKLNDGYVLMTESLPRHLRVKAKRSDQEMGVTCISYKPDDKTTFLIGSESGGVFKCSTETRGSPASRDIISSVELRSPVTFCFSPHHGPVHSVDFSPYHRNLFLSCGTDNSLRLYSVLQALPLVTLEPNQGYLYSARWSPSRPLVFSVATEQGVLLLYDLKQSQSVPVLKLQTNTKAHPVYTMQFNTYQRQMMATGDGGGNIQIWKLSDELTTEHPREQEVLEEVDRPVQDT